MPPNLRVKVCALLSLCSVLALTPVVPGQLDRGREAGDPDDVVAVLGTGL